MIADTSRVAYFESASSRHDRQELAHRVVKQVPMMTAYEYSQILGFTDPNMVRPRITELLQQGVIKRVGKRRCSITKKRVYVYQ